MKHLHFVSLAMFLTAALCPGNEPARNGKAMWKPSPGDSWVYRVQVEVTGETKLPMGIPGQKIERLGDGKVRASYRQVSTYRGLVPMREGEDKVHAFYITNGDGEGGGRLEEIHYWDITGDAVEALGSKQEGDEPREVIKLSQPVPLVRSEWKGGESYSLVMDQPGEENKLRLTRQFRVIGWETLETDAGKFKAMHVQVTGMNGPMEIKRSYWFAPGSGFIKEVKKYYLVDKVIFTQTKVLAKMTRGTGDKTGS